jgi:CHASE2 domain-containing sensor protein
VKGGILAAWLAAMGIVGWRLVHNEHRIPAPGALLGITGLFVAGALVAEWVPKSEPLVLATLVGLDVAAFLNLLPGPFGAELTAAEKAQGSATSGAATGTTQAPGTSTAGGRG